MTTRTLSTESEEAARAFASQRTSSQRDSARENQGNSQTPPQAQDSGETEKVSEVSVHQVSPGDQVQVISLRIGGRLPSSQGHPDTS